MKIFIASSEKGIPVAKALQSNLSQLGYNIRIWNQGAFRAGENLLDAIIEEIRISDFAITVFNGDDPIKKDAEDMLSPRDNVVLETGICLSTLGRQRTFYVFDKSSKVKIPSDLSGVLGISYTSKTVGSNPANRELQGMLGAASTEIENAISEIGPRKKFQCDVGDYKAQVDIYYFDEKFSKETAASIAKELSHHKIDSTIMKHYHEPDAVFIGCCVPAYCARLVISLVPYEIKYIFRLDYNEADGGDDAGFKIGIGYSSAYLSHSDDLRSKPVPVTQEQLGRLLDKKRSNTEFHACLHDLTMK